MKKTGQFWEGKWKQIDTNIGTNIDVSVKAEKSAKRWPTNAKWELKTIKNRLKFEIQDRMPVGTDFSPIIEPLGNFLGPLGRLLGPSWAYLEKQICFLELKLGAKIDEKSMLKKNVF